MNGKGDKRCPSSIGPEERRIREALAWGTMTFKTFEAEYNRLLREGKITRNGRKVSNG